MTSIRYLLSILLCLSFQLTKGQLFSFDVNEEFSDSRCTVTVNLSEKTLSASNGQDISFNYRYYDSKSTDGKIGFSMTSGSTPIINFNRDVFCFIIYDSLIIYNKPDVYEIYKFIPVNSSSFTSAYNSLVFAISGGNNNIVNENNKNTSSSSNNIIPSDGVILSCPDSKHPHVIDMGNAGKWACCNVGASAPWEYGDYYAWGEIKKKSKYTFRNYKHWDKKAKYLYPKVRNIGNDITGSDYDVAHKKWGGSWQMPNLEQAKLLMNCSSTYTEVNGVKGVIYTSSNGNSIFLPTAGMQYHGDRYPADYTGTTGNYWLSTNDPKSQYSAYQLFFSNKSLGSFGSVLKECGRSVRPVSK